MSLIERKVTVPNPDIRARVDTNGAILRIYSPALRADCVDVVLSLEQLKLLVTEVELTRKLHSAKQEREEVFKDGMTPV